jgi:hypothetical protein
MTAEQEPQGTLAKTYILEVLQKEHARNVRHPVYGDGYNITLGFDDSEAALEVFPEAQAVRMLSGSSGVEIYDVASVTRHYGRLRMESVYEFERVVGEVAPDGTFTYFRQPRYDSAERFEETPSSGSKETPRVTLRGRLGAEPRFRTTARRGELVSTFPLGEHPDAETTIWHSIVAFKKLAQRLQEHPLKNGQEVEVVGYVHERTGRTREGKEKVKVEVHAAAIRTTLNTPPTSS